MRFDLDIKAETVEKLHSLKPSNDDLFPIVKPSLLETVIQHILGSNVRSRLPHSITREVNAQIGEGILRFLQHRRQFN
jgi:3-methyladenine DNA glycosylase/8-oxoguanine DNA glycosylase